MPFVAKKRVLLIDYDRELMEVFGELLEDSGIEVIPHTCQGSTCVCAEKALAVAPDLVLVNVAQTSGWNADLRGWRCLRHIRSDPRTRQLAALGYSILDSCTLEELGIAMSADGLVIRPGISNPGDFTDDVARSLQVGRVA